MPKSRRIGPAPREQRRPYEFPEAGEFLIYSRPEFYVEVDGRGERVICNAELRVRTTEANESRGRRRVAVKVIGWEVTGRSRLLDSELRFRAARGRSSYVQAGSERADLPGRMVIAVDMETWVDGALVDSGPGRAEGLISSFPPSRGDVFALVKPETTKDLGSLTEGKMSGTVRIQAIACACNDSSTRAARGRSA
jgi:hypothetical protein